jgi:integrase
MTELEKNINTVLQQLKPELAAETWVSRRRYFNQMLKIANSLNISEPCQKLYDAYVADDNGSKERRDQHIRCVKLLDAVADTNARDERGVLYNETILPGKGEVQEYFQNLTYPLAEGVSIDYIIVKAELEMQYLGLSKSTIGQYRHAWTDIRRYFYINGSTDYDKILMQRFLHEIDFNRQNGSMYEWTWKINRKAAHVLLEVADTGRFRWGCIKRNISCTDVKIEPIRDLYLTSLRQRNLSKSTIGLHDYVFRKTMIYVEARTQNDLMSLAPEKVQLAIRSFSNLCNNRSMATIIPILRSLFTFLLAIKLGVRDCDICNLTFQDIDWHNDIIQLNQKKTGKPLILPLLPDVGNALMEYILNERPKRDDRYPYIFLREQAPYNKLTSAYPICSKLLCKVNIQPENGGTRGVHLFRYTMVHRLLAAKIPHQIITNAIGHISKESDKPYLSMEESMLRMCALDLSVIGSVSWKGDSCNE